MFCQSWLKYVNKAHFSRTKIFWRITFFVINMEYFGFEVKNMVRVESLQETCITSLESFEPMVTKLCSGQEMLYKINQRGIIKNRTRLAIRFLCTALRVIAKNMHTKYGVIRTYGDKVMLRTRNAL